MGSKFKVKRNDSCPCLGGDKYKNCCYGRVDWEAIKRLGIDPRPYLSTRGRNLYFVARIAEALELDAPKRKTLEEYKRAFTSSAVRKIHEALIDIWPPDINIVEALRQPKDLVSGLYVGDYSSDYLKRAVVRHSIYASRILLIDPFIYPPSVRDEYNPILNPEQYRAQTLRNVNMWFDLLPWIESGIVSFIRPPSDFDPRLNWDLMKAQEKKFEESPELRKATEESISELTTRHKKRLLYQQLLLGAPDSYLAAKFEELGLASEGVTVDTFLRTIHAERAHDPDFLEPLASDPSGQLVMMSSGTSYPSALLTANLANAYLFTDISVRWREIELDRQSNNAINKVWAPFAKALQDAPLRYLNNLRLEHALNLRNEGRLESLRNFLAKVWKSARSNDHFDSANAHLLSEELNHEVRAAEQEWRQIDRDLLKNVSTVAVSSLLASGPLIANGHANFLAAAVCVAGGLPLIGARLQRRSFPDRYPAAFFMKIEDKDA